MAEVVKVSKSTQKKSILNWFLSCAVGGNYEFMHGVGFMYSMVPVVKELYPNDVEKQKETLTRHLTFLNTEPEVGTVIHGVTIAMEEQGGSRSGLRRRPDRRSEICVDGNRWQVLVIS